MIPYVELSEIPGIGLPTFTFLVALGITVGLAWSAHRGRQYGVPLRRVIGLFVWVVVPSFLGSHTLGVLMYEPGRIPADPAVLIRFGESISAFAGLISFGITLPLYLGLTRTWSSGPRFIDLLNEGFIVAWIFGRLGCSIVHDHPGVRTSFFMGVRYPDGTRHDLGLYEFLFTVVVLFPLSLWIHRSRRPPGSQFAWFAIAFGLFRLAFDYLRVGEERYLGWTPGQYAGLALLTIGLLLLLRKTVSGTISRSSGG